MGKTELVVMVDEVGDWLLLVGLAGLAAVRFTVEREFALSATSVLIRTAREADKSKAASISLRYWQTCGFPLYEKCDGPLKRL